MDLRKLICSIGLPLLLLFSLNGFAQDRTINGKVTDTAGRGIAGASVSVKGLPGRGTTTNTSGDFTLAVPAANNTLIISSVGYGMQEVEITGTTVSVTMQAISGNLNEIVVIGYGTARRRDLTGSITTVGAKDFNRGAITTPEQLIAGKVAGVQIVSNGGAPGAGSTIRIRGGASLNASNDPLIVIDGVPIDNGSIAGAANPLSLINPNDIESFNILKDASATAIYGSRASNGVIIITTKKGRAGKPRVSFSSSNAVATLSKKAEVLDADEFRAFVNKYGTQAHINLLGTANTDWQDEVFDRAFTTDNNISVAGSIKALPYRFSLGYLNQDGILRTGYLKRTSGSLSLTPVLLNNHLKIDVNLKGSFTNTRFADEGAIANAARFDPTKPVKTNSKSFGGYYEWLDPNSTTGLKELAPLNPVGLLEQRKDVSDVWRSIGNIQFDYKLHFFPDLRLNLNLGYDISRGEGTVFIPDSAASSYKRTPDAMHGGVNNRYLQKKSNELLEFYMNYVKDIKSMRSRIDAMAGYSYQRFTRSIYNAEKDPNGVLYIQEDGTLGLIPTPHDRYTPFSDWTTDGTLVSFPTYPFDRPENLLISFYGRLNYTFNTRYILTATLRRDGSSRFSKDNRWGWFPSAAFAWRMKDESFLRNSRLFSDLKLRLGYGLTGQQEGGVGDYDYIPRYSQSNNTAQYQLGNEFWPMYRPEKYNPNLKWEETATYNAGLDFGFLNGRLSGTLDFYMKKTSDLLSLIDQPAGTGFSNTIIANIGDMTNRGVELAINSAVIKKQDFTLDLGFNATYNKNKIDKLAFVYDPNSPGNAVGGIAVGVGSNIQIHTVGFPKNSFYVYQQIYDKAGKPIEGLFEDRNRDGIINELDLYRYKSPDPTWFFGAYANTTWRKWDAGFTVRANIDNYMYNNRHSGTGTIRNLIDPLGYLANGYRTVLETGFTGAGDKYFFSDYYVENASFLRMDNIYLGYNAGSLLHRNTNLRFGFTVQNVFVITKYSGLDPELSGGIDNNFYPRPRNYVLNVNLNF